MVNMNKLNLNIKNYKTLSNILGDHDKNLFQIGYHFQTEIIVNANEILVDSDDKDVIYRLETLFNTLIVLDSFHVSLRERDVKYIAQVLDVSTPDEVIDFYKKREEIVKTFTGKSIYPKTLSQKQYLKDLERNDVIFAVGVAGVGKTYVAVADAVKQFKEGRYQKIILSRPVVEAGESLGYLPGDMKEKIDPYLIPLYDALYELMGKRATDEYIEDGTIEIAPLAYMRGRTLENAYVILDEAQNTTKRQMKLFLTRLGFNTKMVVTGDVTQIDLPKAGDSGLSWAVSKLEGIKGLKITKFSLRDVVRNPLVERIIERLGND